MSPDPAETLNRHRLPARRPWLWPTVLLVSGLALADYPPPPGPYPIDGADKAMRADPVPSKPGVAHTQTSAASTTRPAEPPRAPRSDRDDPYDATVLFGAPPPGSIGDTWRATAPPRQPSSPGQTAPGGSDFSISFQGDDSRRRARGADERAQARPAPAYPQGGYPGYAPYPPYGPYGSYDNPGFTAPVPPSRTGRASAVAPMPGTWVQRGGRNTTERRDSAAATGGGEAFRPAD